MLEKLVLVQQWVSVKVDESKFTEEFLREFQEVFYPFTDIDDHIKHIAQLEVRGLLGEFTEGYGKIEQFGIEAEVTDQIEEIEE